MIPRPGFLWPRGESSRNLGPIFFTNTCSPGLEIRSLRNERIPIARSNYEFGAARVRTFSLLFGRLDLSRDSHSGRQIETNLAISNLAHPFLSLGDKMAIPPLYRESSSRNENMYYSGEGEVE